MSSSTQEKVSLLPNPGSHNQNQQSQRRYLKFVTLAAIATVLSTCVSYNVGLKHSTSFSVRGVEEDLSVGLCPQSEVLIPVTNCDLWNSIGREIDSDAFQATAIDWLSGAVQIQTETFDDMGPVGGDTRWENRYLFHAYLLKRFPLFHATLTLKKVNTYGLLYTWKGSDTTLKPVLYAAHFDVVPVNPDTVNEWSYPPYSGYFDGELIWGRGSIDDKSALIGIMAAVETLLKNGFKPSRTIVIPFGFDEEAGGRHGAASLAIELLDTYGEDAFAFVIDEGGGFMEKFGTVFAVPGVAEKGSMNVDIEVAAPGGHSSVPFTHTSIGILSALLVHLENHPFDVHFERETPAYELLQCFAEHAKDVPPSLRKTIKRSATSDQALLEVEKVIFQDRLFKSLVGTTQAVDIIRGGVKSNALPEQAWAVVNHRIATTSSVNATSEHDARLFSSLAEEFNLTYTAFGHLISPSDALSSSGSLNVSSAYGLEPAPVTPTKGDEASPYRLLAGTIRATYNAHRGLGLKEEEGVVVGPGMPTGNTDTKYYWGLSKHIFRYNHHSMGNSSNPLGGAHTVNEALPADSLLEIIRFFVTLILNADESKEI